MSIRAQIIDAKLQAHDRINKLEPSVEEVSLSGGDSIRLSIIPYGRQNIVDDALIDGKVGVTWSLEDGTGDFRESDPGLDADNDANDREIIFTAPTNPGTYMVHADSEDVRPRCLSRLSRIIYCARVAQSVSPYRTDTGAAQPGGQHPDDSHGLRRQPVRGVHA